MEHTAMEKHEARRTKDEGRLRASLGTRAASPWSFVLRTSSFVLAALAACAACAIDFAWTPRLDRAEPVEIDLYRGETLRLQPILPTNVVAESLHWQTNGMGSLWWSVPGTVFAPANDCGAPRYRFFVRCRDAAGVAYRANGALRMLDSPGERPNELPLPVPSIDFGAVAVTNAPWALPADVEGDVAAATNAVMVLARADIAAATNAIPQPDMSAYVKKSGDTMTGSLHVAATPGWFTPSIDLDAGVGNVTVRTRKLDPAHLWLANYNGDGIEVMDGETGMDFRILKFPMQSGTLMVQPDSPYAEASPWSISAAPRTTEIPQTRQAGDILEEVSAANSVLSYQLEVEIEDRPDPYSYDAPEVEWSVEDPAGCVSYMDNGLLVASGNEGVAIATATAANGETRTHPVTFARANITVLNPCAGDAPGTVRHTWSTNLAARIAGADTNELRRIHADGLDWNPCPATNWPDCFFPYAYGTTGYATNSNAHFFWPELADSLRCVSAQINDFKAADIQTQVPIPYLAVSEHYAITAAHWFYYGLRTDVHWSLDGATFINRGKPQWLRGGGYARGDLRLVKFNVAVPTNLVCRLISTYELEKLSPSKMHHELGIEMNQHGYISTIAAGPGRAYGKDWTAAGNGLDAAWHAIHGGDSGHVAFLVTPRAELVPLMLHTTVSDGPDLTDPDNIAWLKATVESLSGGTETIHTWTADELR